MRDIEVLSTQDFAKRILNMDCCKFNLCIKDFAPVLTITKMQLGLRLLVLFMNEYHDNNGENTTSVFHIEGFNNDFGMSDGWFEDDELALKSVVDGLNTYCKKLGAKTDSWEWDEELYKERECVDIMYSTK